MLRAIGGALVGYVAMFVVVFVVFTLAYLAMGADGAFKEGSWDTSALWIVVSVVVGLVGALLGGMICAAIARDRRGTWILIGIVVVLGLLSVFASPGEMPERPEVRGPDVGNMEAMQYAKQPTWMAYANILIGVVGVLIGARLVKLPAAEGPQA